MGKVRVWGPLGSSAFRYDARPRGDLVDPPEALDSDISDVRGVLKFRDLARNVANGNISILKRQLGLVKVQLDLTKPNSNVHCPIIQKQCGRPNLMCIHPQKGTKGSIRLTILRGKRPIKKLVEVN